MKKQIGIKIEEDLIELMDKEAKLLYVTRTEFITRACVEFIARQERERSIWGMSKQELEDVLTATNSKLLSDKK